MFSIKISQALCLLGIAFIAIAEAQQIAPPPPGYVTPSGNWPPVIGEMTYNLNTVTGRAAYEAYRQRQFLNNQAFLNAQFFRPNFLLNQEYFDNLDAYFEKLEPFYLGKENDAVWEKTRIYIKERRLQRKFLGEIEAENGDLLGQDNDGDGIPEPVYKAGYWSNGVYHKSHYAALPEFDPLLNPLPKPQGPLVAENGDVRGKDNDGDGRIETIFVKRQKKGSYYKATPEKKYPEEPEARLNGPPIADNDDRRGEDNDGDGELEMWFVEAHEIPSHYRAEKIK